MTNFKKLLCAAAISTIGFGANAGNIVIDTGTAIDFYMAGPGALDFDGNSMTSAFDALTVDVTATSTLTGPTTFSEAGSGNLLGLSGAADASDTEALNQAWSLTASWDNVTGSFVGGLPVFDGGSHVDLVFNDLINGTSEQVLRLELSGGGVSGAGVVLQGLVDFDFMSEVGYSDDTAADPMSFFSFEDPVAGFTSFYDVWTAGQSIYLPLRWDMEFNVDDAPYLDDGSGVFSRTTDFTAEVRFNAPEPSSLALLALGLLGFGASRKLKK